MAFWRKEEIPDDYEAEAVRQYTSAFSGPSGEWVLKDLYRLCLIDQSVFQVAEFDPVRAAFLEGMRYVVLRLLGYSGKQPFEI